MTTAGVNFEAHVESISQKTGSGRFNKTEEGENARGDKVNRTEGGGNVPGVDSIQGPGMEVMRRVFALRRIGKHFGGENKRSPDARQVRWAERGSGGRFRDPAYG